MATRSRTGGSPKSQYQDFHPMSEWKEEEEANILLIHLPGFEREHIRITYVHSTRLVRVEGERSLGNDLWSRFNEAFPVPQNCIVDKISGKLLNGVISITMPKQTITRIMSPKGKAKLVEQAPISPKDTKETLPKVSPKVETKPVEPPLPPKSVVEPIKHSKDQKELPPVEPSLPPKSVSEPIKPSKDQQQTPPKPKITPKDSNQKVGSSEIPQEAAMKSKIEEVPKEASSTSTAMKSKDEYKEVPKAEVSDGKSIIKPTEPRKKTSLDKESRKKRKELVIADGVAEKKEKKEKKGKDDILDSFLAKVSKRSMKELVIDLKEERQALVNAGVAVLVIVALGAYISYKIKSSGNTRN